MREQGRLLRAIVVAAIVAVVSACGGSGTGPTASDIEAFVGEWTGPVRWPTCTTGCLAEDVRRFTLRLSRTEAAVVSGQLTIGMAVLDVRGQIADDRSLQLTGLGKSPTSIATYTIASSRTTVSGNALSGDITFRLDPATISTVPVTLTHVFKAGSPEAARPIPADLRAYIYAYDVNAGRFTTGSTLYGHCFSMATVVPLGGTITWTMTPLGADGAGYDVRQASFPSRLEGNTVRFGCGGASAWDDNRQRGFAPNARVRAEILFDDGVTTAGELVLPVRGGP